MLCSKCKRDFPEGEREERGREGEALIFILSRAPGCCVENELQRQRSGKTSPEAVTVVTGDG